MFSASRISIAVLGLEDLVDRPFELQTDGRADLGLVVDHQDLVFHLTGPPCRVLGLEM